MKKFIFYAILVITTSVILLYIVNKYEVKESDVISSYLLLWTLIAIIWYSWETKELKEVSVKRPCISFNVYSKEIYLKNYGEGVARCVEIQINNETIHTIPLISSIHSSSSQPLPLSKVLTKENYERLCNYEGIVFLCYYDQAGKTRYITKIKYNFSDNVSDGCEIISYDWK